MTTPKVSIIIPNYNKAPFLEKRIQSILNQTYQDFEIIVVDDASTDNSREIFQRFADHARFSKIRHAEVNGGIFVTWNKGLKEATGEYVWIAESDDYADPRLLETLVTCLEQHPNVGLAYCQSLIVNEHDTILSRHEENELPYWDPERWQHDFIRNGRQECQNYLLFKNTIPNASAVVFRRTLYQKTGGPPESMKINGDWVFWSTLLCQADIAFVAEPLNYFRTHSGTMRSVNKVTGRNIEESFLVLQHFTRILDLSDERLHAALTLNVQAWISATFKYQIPFSRQRTIYRLARSVSSKLPGILLRQSLNTLLHSIKERVIAPLRIKLKLGTRVKNMITSQHSIKK